MVGQHIQATKITGFCVDRFRLTREMLFGCFLSFILLKNWINDWEFLLLIRVIIYFTN